MNRWRVTSGLGALLSAIVVLIHVWQGGPALVHSLFKPLVVVFLMVSVWVPTQGPSSRYRYAILGGLGFSLAGDIFLMLPQDLFVPGLVSFLVAHLFYIVAFAPEALRRLSMGCAVPFVVYGVGLNALLYGYLGAMRWPVWAYSVAILTMAYFALRRWMIARRGAALLAFVGAVLFVLSDSVIAISRFRGGFPQAGLVILSTYFLAQSLIALSACGRKNGRIPG